ncbi:imidazolonepropionase [Polaribacter tangerinus]|uniref:imidazolonepropionase n=1 Tax=Polaribacter tangerinus TaxID=1920034 RepID=UPI000B4ADCE7|nr:imidazolonepropionase [Polaribacter tangerinus]
MKLLFKNIKELIQIRDSNTTFVAGKEMGNLPSLKNAFLIVEDGVIADFGKMNDCPNDSFTQTIDATGKILMPTWCDSHTHIVYAGSRETEFVDRLKGKTYEDIAKNGGGILNSAKRLERTTAQDLYTESKLRLDEVIKLGTGAIEIKSGYGLTKDAELKMLRVIKKLQKNYPIEIKVTFLGAHAVPSSYKNKKNEYLKMLIDDVLPIIKKEKLADFIDVFCEEGYFSVSDTHTILKAGKDIGLQGKIHVNQFHSIGGVAAGVENNVLSLDHLEILTDADINSLKNTKTMPVALPSCSFFLGLPYTPARKIINAHLPIALASDYNPGSSPSGNMNFVVATACIKMKMTPEEAINAATINGAYAMNLSNKIGSITKGKLANIMLTKPIQSYAFIPYSFGNNCIEKVFVKGKEILTP